MSTRHACRNECGSISPSPFGWLLLGAGLVINRWTLGLLAPDGQIDGEWRNAQIAGLQALLVLSGAVFCAPATSRNRSLLRLTLNSALTEAEMEHVAAVAREVAPLVKPWEWPIARRQRSRDA